MDSESGHRVWLRSPGSEDVMILNLLYGLHKRKKASILTENELQRAYFILLKECLTGSVASIMNETGIKPSKDVSVAAQKFILREGKIGAIERVQRITGVKPKFGKYVALDAYRKLNKKRTTHLVMPHFIKTIRKITGVKATDRIVNSWYETLMKNNALESIKSLEKITGKKSRYHTEVEFLLALRKADFNGAERIYEANKAQLKRFKKIESIFKRINA